MDEQIHDGASSNTEAKKTIKRQTEKAAFELERSFSDELLKRANEERIELSKQFSNQSNSTTAEPSTSEDRFSEKTIPNQEHFDQLVRISFWASLRKEEGKFANFAVAYEEKSENRWTIVFKRPIPFDVKHVAKLAPAIGNLKAAIKVYPDANGVLQIWGVSNYYDTPFTVKVLDPGEVIVSYFIKNLGVISGEESFFIDGSLHDRSELIWALLGTDGARDFSPLTDPRVTMILNALRTMRALERGGTLIILPDGDKWRESITSIGYEESSPQHRTSELLREYDDLLRPQVPTREGMERLFSVGGELERLADSLAQLTSVDGATLVSKHLEIVGFGAKIQYDPKKEDPQLIYKIDPQESEDFVSAAELSESGGMRHQSAAHFVSKNQEAIAIVVSQDGNVTAFVWRDNIGTSGAVLAFARLELTLF